MSFKVNNKDGWLSSSVKRYSSLEVAKEAINDHEIEKFCKYILHRRSSYEDSQHHIRWDPADNIPYVISSSYKYECQHGKDRNKFYNKKRQIGNYLSGKKTYKSIKESIKKDCPAFITIREVIKFPLFKPINASLRQRRESSKMLRHALLNEDDIEKILVCYVKFPDDSDHKGHALGEIRVLVAQGVTSISEIKQHLHKFVTEQLFKNKPPPSTTNRRFYPTDKCIRNHCYKAGVVRQGKKSQLEDEIILETCPPDTSDTDLVNIIIDTTDVTGAIQPLHILALLDTIRDSIHDGTSVDLLQQAEALLQQTVNLLQSSQQNNEKLHIEQSNQLTKKRKLNVDNDRLTKYQKIEDHSFSQFPQSSTVNDFQVHFEDSRNFSQTYSEPEPSELHATKVGDKVTVKERLRKVSKVVPEIPLSGGDATQQVLMHGPHAISYFQLMSLKPSLNVAEQQYLLSHDRNFKVGWLCESIINSYLWQICSTHENCIYADSALLDRLQRGTSIDLLWQGVDFNDKIFAFIPWNTSGLNWVLLVVDIKQRKLLYLDPSNRNENSTSKNVHTAKCYIQQCLFKKFGFCLLSVSTNVPKIMGETLNTGLYICMYANWLAEGACLTQPHRPEIYRKQILTTLVGNCLIGAQKKDICKVCHLNVVNAPLSVRCIRCEQLYHATCVRASGEQINFDREFICPLIRYR